MEILEKKRISLGEVKKLLEKRSKEKPLEYEHEKTMELIKIVWDDKKNGKCLEELKKELKDLPEEFLINVAEVMPKMADTVKLIAYSLGVEIADETVEKIVEIVKKYA